jgi:glycosyltransferase involved in cell wall biosynthesis
MILNEKGLTDDFINTIYNLADIGLNCSEAESFGLCTFEMMGLSKPQVITEHNSVMTYCTRENSLPVPIKHNYYTPTNNDGITGYVGVSDVTDICDGLVTYLNDPELVKRHGLNAQQTVSKYTWPHVMLDFVATLRVI